MKTRLRAGALCAAPIALLLATSPVSAHAQTISFHLPAGPLAQSLMLYAKTTNRQISFSSETVARFRTGTLDGDFTPDEVLDRLLRGTGLSVRTLPSGVIVVEAPRARLTPIVAYNAADAGDGQPVESGRGGVPPPAPAEVGEVIVTAQRRAQRLQDVPISVTALSPQVLKNAAVTSTRDLAMVTPGLRMDSVGVFVQPVIRGITTYNDLPATDANIATYIDGVYQQSMIGAFYDLPDIQEIEVLKGPQGTLFGRNATGGAILVNTLNPNLTEATGQLTVGGGKYGNYYGRGFVSVPIVQDKVAASLSFNGEHSDGYLTDIVSGRTHTPVKNLLVRGKLRFLPWEGADFVLTGVYAHVVDHQTLKATNYLGNNVSRLFVPASEIASRPYTYSSGFDSVVRPTTKSVSLRGNIRVGPGTFTTTTAYVHADQTGLLSNLTNSTLPGARVYFPNAGTRTTTQEFVYSTDKIDRFQGTAGAFFYKNTAKNWPLSYNNYTPAIWTLDKDLSYGLFVDGTYDITDRLSLTGGLRYSWEKRSAYIAISFSPTPPNVPLLGKKSWTSVTPRVSLVYKANDQTNLYFTFSQGFKSGTFNTNAHQQQPVDPEKVNAFEVGAKSNISPDLSLNAAVFYYDYKGLQIPSILTVNGILNQVLENAAHARIYGVELNGAWNVSDELKFTFGGTYLHARFTKYPNAALNIPKGGATGNIIVPTDVRGNTLPSSPTFSANVTGNYVRNTAIGRLDASATLYYSTKVFFEVGNRIVQPSYATLNMALSWSPPGNSNIEIRAWGKNLTNRTLIQSTLISTTADAVLYGPPRTYGIEANYKF